MYRYFLSAHTPHTHSQIALLEKELRTRDSIIQDLQGQAGTVPMGTTNVMRRLRDELEDLRLETAKDKRMLSQEKGESQRLVEELAAERLKVRQVRNTIL